MSSVTLCGPNIINRVVELPHPEEGEVVSSSVPSRKGTLRPPQQQQQHRRKQRSPIPGLVFVCVVLHIYVLLSALSVASGFNGGEIPGMAGNKDIPAPTRGGSKLSCVHHNEQLSRHSAAPLSPPILELITPDGCSSSSPPDTSCLVHGIQSAAAGGVSLVQLRDYKSDAKSKADMAVRLVAATEGRALFVVNGEPDAARASGADGVHLPERMIDRLVDLRGAGAGAGAGEWPRVVGCSVHSVAAAVKAARLGADYLQVGTMFTTLSHPGKEPEGLDLLNDVRRRLQVEDLGSVWVIGVGGIDASNCGEVVAAGGDGVAAIRCLCASDDAEGEAQRMILSMRGSLAASDRVGSPGDSVR